MDKIIHDLYQSENNGILDIDSVQNSIMLSKKKTNQKDTPLLYYSTI